MTIAEIIDIILQKRGIAKEQKDEFFTPPNPENLSVEKVGINKDEVEKSVKRIRKAIKNKEKIIIFGDYDVDGVCASAILWESLYALGANVLPHIPSRFTEGYGLKTESLEALKKEHPDTGLIITVDNGITAKTSVEFAKSLGLDVIITDHHQPGEAIPKAHSIIHTTSISGSSIAYFLARSLGFIAPDHLGLATLGTVADVLPLTSFNRSIVAHGLGILRETKRPGIVALCNDSGVKQEEIGTFHIGFIIGPRLNSAGRIEHAMDSLRLLCTRNFVRAAGLAEKLGMTNRVRQEKTQNIVDYIEANFAPSWKNNLPKLLFVHDPSFDEGVVGIVAGRLVEKYARPSIVVSQQEKFSKGSARSILGVNIIETIKKLDPGLFESAGGHPMAAGFTIRTKNLKTVHKNLLDITEKEITDDQLVKNLNFDCELAFENITEELERAIRKFEPFGFGNRDPLFLTHNVFVKAAKRVGKHSEHLKLLLGQENNGKTFDISAIGFQMGEIYPKLSPRQPVQIVYSIEQDHWNDASSLQLKLKDVKLQQ